MEDAEEHVDKKTRMEILSEIDKSISVWRQNNIVRHTRMLEKVLTSDQNVNLFQDRLFETCKLIFLEGRAALWSFSVLRVPNFVITEENCIYPATIDAQIVYFKWFRDEKEKRTANNRISRVATLLDHFLFKAVSGGERGNSFEKYLAAKLAMQGKGAFNFAYTQLATEQQVRMTLRVDHLLYARADSPPKNFQLYPDFSLRTHPGIEGGEARIDLIHYTKNRVTFIEATDGNYRASKIPQLDDNQQRGTLILNTIRKWLGWDVFDVNIVSTPAAGQHQNSGQKQLVVTYRAERSNRTRPNPPSVQYIIVTTCPKTVKLQGDRVCKYNWIGVCYLDDLIDSGIFEENHRKEILAKQEVDAGYIS